MSDETRMGVDDDGETPVNPYSLLAAVNTSGRSANMAWLIFLGLMAYLCIAVASVTHRDLLLNSDVTLPILQVKISLSRFFLAVPIVLVLLHAALLGRLALLARKAREFDAALRLLESTDERSHPLRLEIESFFFVQAIAGPERSRVMSTLLNSVSWLTLAVFPLALLLYVQIAFLPFHDVAMTIAHRLVVLADIVVLLLMGVFLMRSETTYFSAVWRTALHNPGSLVFGIAVLVAAAVASAFATVPGHGQRDGYASLLTAADGSLFGIFPRNLNVADADLTGGKAVAPINLRGRDLRSARLDRTDLRKADLTGANLDGASLAGADLGQARLQCDDSADLPLADNRQGAPCASARGANFARARLGGAEMTGLDMRGARFVGAVLDGANLGNAQMIGVDFSHADLQRADLSGGAALQGAKFEQASLQGADLSGARLQMADFTGAALQGATLSRANLEGASLRDAALDGASLQAAKLFGADLRGARLNFVDMSRALVWRTLPPGADNVQAADLARLAISPPSDEDLAGMRSVVDGLEAGPAKVRLAGLMAPLNDAGPNGTWSGSPEALAWNSLVRISEAGIAEGYRARLTEQLGRLICRARSSGGAMAAGIVRRVGASGFKGDAAALHDRIKGADCPAAATIPPPVMQDLAAAADAVRAQ